MRMQGVIEDLALPARYWRLRLALYSRTGNCPPARSIRPPWAVGNLFGLVVLVVAVWLL